MRSIPLAERFWSKVNKDGPEVRPGLGRCWVWMASTNKKGYGRIGKAGKYGPIELAHRVSWAMAFGAIDGDGCVLHRCDNPGCVRPEHLFIGTRADNNADMKAKARSPRGTDQWHAKLTEDDVREIRRRAAEGYTLRSLADLFGVSVPNVHHVVKRDTWSHVQ